VGVGVRVACRELAEGVLGRGGRLDLVRVRVRDRDRVGVRGSVSARVRVRGRGRGELSRR